MRRGFVYSDGWCWDNLVLPSTYFVDNNGVHAYGVNVLFVDGHVDYKKANSMPSLSTNDGKIFWHGAL